MKRNQRGGRASDVHCIRAFCLPSFRSFTTIENEIVHSAGELQGEVRVAACKYVPDACRQFYLAEREREAAAATERAAQKSEFTRMQQKREKVIQAKGRLLMNRQKVSQPAQFGWLSEMASELQLQRATRDEGIKVPEKCKT